MPPPNPADCPATRASVPLDAACATKSACAYDGASCSCGPHCRQYPVGEAPCNPDAGVTQNCCDTTKAVWGCFDGPKYCTNPRPRVGSACTEGDSCALEAPGECGQAIMLCQKGVWSVPSTECPISSARAKKEIVYVDGERIDRLHDALMSTRLATYRYIAGDDSTHLGFIIEDMPASSPAVLATRDRVDLYGYASMAVASLQHQQREIDALRIEIQRLSAENEAMKRGQRR